MLNDFFLQDSFGGVYYLTALVYTKTTIHLSVGGWRWIFTEPRIIVN